MKKVTQNIVTNKMNIYSYKKYNNKIQQQTLTSEWCTLYIIRWSRYDDYDDDDAPVITIHNTYRNSIWRICKKYWPAAVGWCTSGKWATRLWPSLQTEQVDYSRPNPPPMLSLNNHFWHFHPARFYLHIGLALPHRRRQSRRVQYVVHIHHKGAKRKWLEFSTW